MTERYEVRLDVVDPSVRGLVAPGARLKEIASGGEWFEGPAWLGDTLVWSDVRGNRLHAWDSGRGARVWIAPSHHQNGHTVDHEGRLVAAASGERAVLRREHDGRWTMLADFYDWKRFNSPNDVVVAADGGIWFTDPTYGLTQPTEGFDPEGAVSEIGGQHVYRIGARGLRDGTRSMTAQLPAMRQPNGLAFGADETVLYVTDSEARHILGFRVRMSLDGPELRQPWIVHRTFEGSPDGLRVDPAGRIWSSSAAGIEILRPGLPGEQARHLGTIRVPQETSNLAFSPDLKRLAITASSSVYLLKLGDVTR
ncbi:gluconolactonase [Serinibacter arcticus]|uniref:Gluconolactonase n=1 Tax=Serinibacter arcticus TaxID=1655435 RepID=A0A2U1ZWQ0_9MICO|nr:SMP-30/gluconolactonase/LRE family protein [Serinibacter arcticus]PWD51416.1 gluconolactonase [Serinibacter arcticus]